MSTATKTAEPNFFEASKGIKSWLVTLDHKRIGLMYLFGIIVAFLLGGFFALAVRLELMWAGETIVNRDMYNQLFTLHGAIMVFLVIIPGIPAALGNIILPIQLGAPDVAFPRLNLASFYLWCGGTLFFLITLATGGVDAGWTFYTPYSTTTDTAVVPAVTAAFVLGFSSIFTGLNFIVTIHKFKPKGMGWFKMPLNLWAIYSTATLQVLATPVVGLTLALIAVERTLGIGIFDPVLGGDPVLFQHFFWFYSHPAVYIMILPGMGVATELITTFAHKHVFGYRFIAYSSISLAMLSFLVWGHHMFVAGQSPLAAMVFSALTFTVAIPSAIKTFNWTATLYKGDIHLTTPMLYGLAFIILFAIGGLTGIFLGTLNVDVALHDTYFIVAHFHYTMMGSTIIAFFGGIHYWWPKIWGRMYNESVGKLCAVVIFIGFNLTFLPQFVLGTRGMHRRYFDYDPQFEGLHQMSSVGAFIMGTFIVVMFANLFLSIKRGKKAPKNPWGATTLEWDAPSPPPLYNFPEGEELKLYPIYDYDQLVYVSEEEGWVRKDVLEAAQSDSDSGAASDDDDGDSDSGAAGDDETGDSDSGAASDDDGSDENEDEDEDEDK